MDNKDILDKRNAEEIEKYRKGNVTFQRSARLKIYWSSSYTAM